MSKFDYESYRIIRLMNMIKEVDDNSNSKQKLIITPIKLALHSIFLGAKRKFLKHENNIDKETGKKLTNIDSLKINNLTKKSSLLNVHAGKLIGLNGAGKTVMSQSESIIEIKNMGLNPVIFSKDAYPKNSKDCIIAYMSAVGREAVDIKGLPQKISVSEMKFKVDKDGYPLLDDNNDYKYCENPEIIDSISYSGIDLFNVIKKFNYAVLIIDEINRSPETSVFNALLNGEPQQGIELAKMGNIIISLANSEMDGLNNVFESDMASKTKCQTFHIYQTVDEWANWASRSDVHPAVISYAMNHKLFFENFIGHDKEMAAPTFRGLEKFSNALYEIEDIYKNDINEMFLKSQVQSFLGFYNNDNNIPESFANFYMNIYGDLLTLFEEVKNKPMKIMEVGFKNKEKNKELLYSFRNKSSIKDTHPLYSTNYYPKNNNVSSFSISIRPMCEKYIKDLHIYGDSSIYHNAIGLALIKNFKTNSPDINLFEKLNINKHITLNDESKYNFISRINQLISECNVKEHGYNHFIKNLNNINYAVDIGKFLIEEEINKIEQSNLSIDEKNVLIYSSSFVMAAGLLLNKILKILFIGIGDNYEYETFKFNLNHAINLKDSYGGDILYRIYKLMNYNDIFNYNFVLNKLGVAHNASLIKKLRKENTVSNLKSSYFSFDEIKNNSGLLEEIKKHLNCENDIENCRYEYNQYIRFLGMITNVFDVESMRDAGDEGAFTDGDCIDLKNI